MQAAVFLMWWKNSLLSYRRTKHPTTKALRATLGEQVMCLLFTKLLVRRRTSTSQGCLRLQQRLASPSKLLPKKSARPRLFRATNPLQPLHTLALCRTLTKRGQRRWNSSSATTTLNAASKAQSESGYNQDRTSQVSSQ